MSEQDRVHKSREHLLLRCLVPENLRTDSIHDEDTLWSAIIILKRHAVVSIVRVAATVGLTMFITGPNMLVKNTRATRIVMRPVNAQARSVENTGKRHLY